MRDLVIFIALLIGWYWLRYKLTRPTRREWYRNTYLWSKHWRETRARKLKQIGYKCEKCGIGGRLDVHHLTYERIGHERMSDLQVLCRSCHNKV